jgi:DNA-binding NarL/FixJ family response regulator
MDKEIKVLIVDDHEIFRFGLRRIIDRIKNVKVIGEAANGNDFLEQLAKLDIDVVLLDIEMPLLNGIEAARIARSIKPNIKIAALTMFNQDEYIQSMLDAGVQGFIMKNVTKDDLSNAIMNLYAGKTYFSEEIWDFFSKKIVQKENPAPTNIRFTKRQREILHLICEGLDNADISNRLFISERTVIGHKSNLLAKTNCKNTASLISYALKNKLVELDK